MDPPSDKELSRLLERYAAFAPSPVSMQDFVNFGRSSDIETSFNFLRHEVPVRIANIAREIQYLPPELKGTRGCQLVRRRDYKADTSCLSRFPISSYRRVRMA